jgi:SynChlorMet cassette protein ScmC
MPTEEKFQGHRSGTWNLLRKLSGFGEPENQLQGFSLPLGDGSHWWVTGIPPASYWVEKVASIMHLPQGPAEGPANGANLMILFEGKNPDKAKRLVESYPGWISIDSNYLTLWYRMDSPDLLAQLTPQLSEFSAYTNIRFVLKFIFRESLKRGGLPFHAALVEHHGKGVLLAGTSGIGKSTCCRRLMPPWQALCDDEVLVTLSPQDNYLAHPFPTWSDYVLKRGEKTYNTPHPSPLAGIFFMEQSSSDGYLHMNPSEALVEAIVSAQVGLARFLWCCNAEEARDLRVVIFANTCELVKKVPVFRLRVSLTGRFWEHLEAALAGL